MNLVKNCSAKRRLRHSYSAITLSSCSASSFFIAVVVIFLSCTLPSCSVLSFKAGHVEAVPGNTILRNPRPLTTGTAGGTGNRNGNHFPLTGTSGGGSRSAILMKLTSPRREFGGHVYEDPNVSLQHSLQSPIASDLYAFSKSTESQQIQHDNEHAPFVRFPTISSPFSNIQSTESHLHHPHSSYPHLRQQQPQTKTANKPDHKPQQQGHQKPLAQSVSDLLAQREEPSLFGGVAPQEDDLLDSYYTTGSDDDIPLSSVDIDRYSSQEEVAAGDLFKKQTATPNTSTSKVNASSPSLASSSAAAAVATNNRNSDKNKSRSSNNSSSSHDNHNNVELSSLSAHSLSKPTLLPLPANYLSLATFRQIDNTLEKSSSNILSRIANFWRNRTMSSHSNVNGTTVAVGNNRNASNSNSSSNKANNLVSSKSSTNSNNYTKLASDSSIDADNNHDKEDDEETDNVFEKNLDDDYVNRSGNNHRNNNNNKRPNINNDNNHGKNFRRQSESSSSSSNVQPTKYISIEDLDGGVSIGGGGGFVGNSNQYLSLDDEEEDAGVGEEDFATSTGGNTKEEEHTTTKTTTKTSSSKQDNNLDDHFLRHHDHRSSSVEDYITSETTSSAQAAGLDDWLLGGEDSAQSSHTFHDDLFHTTTGTITAVIDNSSSSSSSSSKTHHKKDLMNSGSSRIERVHKSDSDKKASIVVSPSSSSAGGASSSKGDVKRAESDKIWSSIDSHFGRNDLIESAESEEEHDYYYGMTIGGFLKRELWTIPLFVLASLNMILIILFEVYVLCRARGTSRRHLFLGQMLLFGLFLCSFLALMFAVHPSIIGCFVGRLGVGITYSLIFSVLMVKCVFLLSLDTGVYLPTSYQGILLFFAVAVQVAIDTQWVIMYPPFLQTVESGRSVLLQCGTSFVQLLYSLSYVGFLILMVGFLAGRAAYKGVVENYREAVYILITAVVTVPVALSWTVAGWMLQGRHQDACVSFGLVAHSLTTFLIMFMPKGRQLASLEKEAVCFEDQEDQCSGYSPSFFHFKPTTKNYKTALWGDGNLYTTLEPTVSTINPNVFFHRNDFHSGMIY